MTMILLTCILLTQMISPTKLSFSITLLSITTAINIYPMSSSVYPSCSVLVSFSSGMMIIFSYCAMMTFYEEKENKKSKMKTTMMVLMLMMMASPLLTKSLNTSNIKKMTMINPLSPSSIAAMSVILITMMCINKSMFSPKKSMNQSY